MSRQGSIKLRMPLRGRRQRAARRLCMLSIPALLALGGSAQASSAPRTGINGILGTGGLPTLQQIIANPISIIGSNPITSPTQPNSPLGALLAPTPAASSDPAAVGAFTEPFVEPTILTSSGSKVTTSNKCLVRPGVPQDPTYDGLIYDCKPAGVSVNVLPNGKLMYFDGLEGTENVKYSIVLEYGNNSVNDQSRVLKLGSNPSGGTARWTVPKPVDGGANPGGQAAGPSEKVLPPELIDQPKYNAGALFCTDNIFLPDGTVMASGGTDYYNEPGIKIGKGNFGVAELEGLRNTRIFNPATNTWQQAGSMHYGRWYPSTVTLPSGHVLVVSGVTKLLKPVYPTHILDSLTNVEQTETYNPISGRWTTNPASAKKSLPLFPRIHELPDGKIFYDAAGQSFNPFGQSYDEALWNVASVYSPATQHWTDLGIPGLTDLSSKHVLSGLTAIADAAKDALSTLRQGGIPGGGSGLTIPGFRGSTFSIELPLVPDAHGNYSSASFLTAGGVINPPSPGSYFATSDSRITTVDTSGGKDTMSTVPTGDLSGPRWYPSGVLLPTGEVLAFNGGDRDAVVGPGVEIGKRQTELFDPATNKWTPVASSHDVRTYHNSAELLPDGRVLVGGHAPISTLYASNITLPGGITAPNDGRDPSFEIYSPPYMFRGSRPKIVAAPKARAGIGYSTTFQIKVDQDAADIASVVLVSNPSVTHLIDPNQRNVVLPVVARDGRTLTVKAPPSADVAPPGPYMLFVNKQTSKGLVPSKSVQEFVGIGGLEAAARHARAAHKH